MLNTCCMVWMDIMEDKFSQVSVCVMFTITVSRYTDHHSLQSECFAHVHLYWDRQSYTCDSLSEVGTPHFGDCCMTSSSR
jgi:hypothetical protein